MVRERSDLGAADGANARGMAAKIADVHYPYWVTQTGHQLMQYHQH